MASSIQHLFGFTTMNLCVKCHRLLAALLARFLVDNLVKTGFVVCCESLASIVRLVSPGKECSNSSWAEMEPYVIGSYRMSPLTPQMHQRLILQYLTPLGEYQEVSSINQYRPLRALQKKFQKSEITMEVGGGSRFYSDFFWWKIVPK